MRSRRAIAAALLAAAVLLAVFVVLAVASGPDSALAAWDRRVSDAFIAWRSPGRSQLFWAMTLVGNTPVLATLSFSAVLLVAVWGRRGLAALIAVGLLVGWGISEAAKDLVGRPRPPVHQALIAVPSSGSMPSGHALTTLVFLGLLVYAAFRWRRPDSGSAGSASAPPRPGAAAASPLGAAARSPRRSPWVWVATAVAVAIVALVGASRVYLGVHWPSDVLGGWSLGAAWLALLLGSVWAYHRSTRPPGGVRRFLCGRRAPARPAVRAASVVFVVILCVVAVVLSARADPLLALL